MTSSPRGNCFPGEKSCFLSFFLFSEVARGGKSHICSPRVIKRRGPFTRHMAPKETRRRMVHPLSFFYPFCLYTYLSSPELYLHCLTYPVILLYLFQKQLPNFFSTGMANGRQCRLKDKKKKIISLLRPQTESRMCPHTVSSGTDRIN